MALNDVKVVKENASGSYDEVLLSTIYNAADVLAKIKTIDGSGSGLDADMLDGYLHAADIKRQTNTVNNNLGTPSVEEMALFHGQFNNKLRFIPAFAQEQSTDGITWVTSTRATTNQLIDIMLGEGQTGGFSAIPAPVVGVPGAAYRLTWDASQTGYICLNAFYTYNSTNGNQIRFKIEQYHNTNGWSEVSNGIIGNWPGHVYLPHSAIWFSTSPSQIGKVRITFQITTAGYANAFDLYSIEWFGGYPAGRRNVEYYDRDKNVVFPARITGTRLAATVADGTSPMDITSGTKVVNLNADKLDDMHADTAASASTVAARDANGYLKCTYINSSRGLENSAAESYLYDTGDGWMRKKTLANVRAELGGSGKGLDADTLDGKHLVDIESILVNQTAHGFSVGNAVGLSGSTWIKAKADSVANAVTLGLVSQVIDANNFRYVKGGVLAGSYTPGAAYYLSTSAAGGLMTLANPEVWTNGQVRQYIGTGTKNGDGLDIEIDLGDEVSFEAIRNDYVTAVAYNENTRVLTLTRTNDLAPLTIALPYPASDIAFEARDVQKGVAQVYELDMKASWPYTILSAVLASNGTLNNVTVKINSTAVGGLTNLAVGGITETNATSANTVAAGDVVTINTTTSYSGNPTLIRVKLKIKRIA